jgi:pilus assembly protein CpaC
MVSKFKQFMLAGLLGIALLSQSIYADELTNEASVSAFVGKSKSIHLTSPVSRVAVGDSVIADYKVVSPTELLVLGKAVGTTNLILWQKNGKSTSIDMTVSVDVSPLEKVIAKQLPQEKGITVSSASGSIVLGGYVSDAVAADTVMSLADAHVRNLNRYLTGAFKESGGTSSAPNPATAMVQIVNMMKVRDPQQVMLEVRVAEVSKKLLDQIGVGFTASSGDVRWKVISGFSDTGATGLMTLFPGKTNNLTVDAQHTDSLVKILAEPNIVASSGQEGSFLVGGRIFIPVLQSTGGSTVASLVEREYGVGLKFVPTVLDGGRINLKVAPEVSEFTNATEFQGGKSPIFTTRRASTTVQLKDGEHLVIGGLMRNNVTSYVKAIPVLGQLPILGALFRSTEYTSDKTELVIVVSPSLVKATPQTPELPTDQYVPPTRSELFIGGKLEGEK